MEDRPINILEDRPIDILEYYSSEVSGFIDEVISDNPNYTGFIKFSTSYPNNRVIRWTYTLHNIYHIVEFSETDLCITIYKELLQTEISYNYIDHLTFNYNETRILDLFIKLGMELEEPQHKKVFEKIRHKVILSQL